jgi:hypothetical protein
VDNINPIPSDDVSPDAESAPIVEQAEAQAPAASEPVATPTETPAQEPEQAGLQHQLGTLQSQMERMRRSMSGQQRKFDTERSTWGQQRDQFEDKLREQKMEGMNDEERRDFQADFYREKYEGVQQQLRQQKYRADVQEAVGEWSDYFLRMGVPADALDNSSIDNIRNSATQWMSRRIGEADTVAPQHQRATPQSVVTTTPQGSNPGHTRMADIPLEEWEDIFKRVETGGLKPDQLPQ